MAVPDPYTEPALMQFMHAEMGEVAAQLGWTVAASSYQPAVDEALLAYGETDISQITGASNLIKLRALARREAWRLAATSLAGEVDFRLGDLSVQWGPLRQRVADALKAAQAAAAPYDSTLVARQSPVPGPVTPYDANPRGELVFGRLA